MYRKILVSIAATALFVATAVVAGAAEPKDVIENGSFETGRDRAPARWRTQVWSGTGEHEYAKEGGRADKRCVVISSSEGGDLSWSTNADLMPQATYRLSGWIKTENLDPGSGRGAQLNVHEMQGVRTPAVTGTKDWTRVETLFETVSAESVQINCLFGGWGSATGKAWFDDISLERISMKELKPEAIIDASKTGEPISKYIYGQFIEHLGRCIYGGIWAEMLLDRKFYYPVIKAEGSHWKKTGAQADILARTPWKVIGDADAVRMIKEDAYVGDHTPEIRLDGEKPAGINQGELGVVKDKMYMGRIVLAGDPKAAPIEISLIWGEAENERQTIRVEKIGTEFVKTPLRFRSGASTDDATLQIVGLGQGAFRVGTASLMPADNIGGWRADTVGLLKQLDSPVYRWPGGNFVSGYDWRDGIGDPDRRSPRKNPAWTGIEHNDVGIHEYMALCGEIKTDAFITVNTGLGTVENAAEEVEYVNGAADTPMGKWRAKNGRAEPWGVKFWAVGNEMYGSWQLGNMPLEEYIKKHNAVAEAMRKRDINIELVAVGAVGRWSEQMMTHCADHMELISEHFYNQTRPGLAAHVAQIPNNVKRIADAHRRYRQTIPALKGKDIRVALDEWNYWYGPHVFGELGTRYFMRDGLGIAAGLHEYFRNSDIIYMANYAQTVNVIGCIKTNKTAAAFETTGLALMLYRQVFGVIPVEVGGAPAPLDVMAAWSEDRKSITVGVVNPTKESYALPLEFKGVELSGKGRLYRIADPDDMAYNDPGDAEPKIKIVESRVRRLGEKVQVPAVSISVFVLEVK